MVWFWKENGLRSGGSSRNSKQPVPLRLSKVSWSLHCTQWRTLNSVLSLTYANEPKIHYTTVTSDHVTLGPISQEVFSHQRYHLYSTVKGQCVWQIWQILKWGILCLWKTVKLVLNFSFEINHIHPPHTSATSMTWKPMHTHTSAGFTEMLSTGVNELESVDSQFNSKLHSWHW